MTPTECRELKSIILKMIPKDGWYPLNKIISRRCKKDMTGFAASKARAAILYLIEAGEIEMDINNNIRLRNSEP